MFTILWPIGFGFGTLMTIPSGGPEAWFFGIGWIVGTAFIWWTCLPLKRVRLNGKSLGISDFSDEIWVPCATSIR